MTSHRVGLLPTLLELDTTPDLLEEILSTLAGAQLLGSLPPARELFSRHRGNVRTALRELYDHCAGLSAGIAESD